MNNLKREITKYNLENNKSIKEFAEMCDVSLMSLRQYMKNINAPSVYAAMRISRVLGKTIEELWEV